jgi:hypothetical protein
VSDFATCIPKTAAKLPEEVRRLLTESDDPDRVLNEYVTTLSVKKKEAAFQAVRLAEAADNIASHPSGFYDGLMSLMVKDAKGKARYQNVDKLQQYYQGLMHSRLSGMLAQFRTKGLGFLQDEENLEKFIRAVYGETTDDATINQWAKDWIQTTELARRLKNRNGASISKNEKFLMPQNHDARALMKVGKDAWKEQIRPMLDRRSMLDDAGKPLTNEQLEDLLDYAYESITTHGLNKVEDLTVPRLGKKLSRRGSERRILYFKDAESWMTYQKDFGKGDLFTTLTDWIDSNAHDIALLEVMGPNPNTTYAALRALGEKQQALTLSQKRMADATFSVISGKTNQGEVTSLADFFQGFRNVITAAFLGKAFLSAISDVGFQIITTRYNNVPTIKTLGRQLKMLSPSSIEDQKVAVRIGLIAEAWINRTHSANRYADVYGTGATAKIADAVMRASLLKPWTDAGRKAFGMEFAGLLADNFGKNFNDLDDGLRRAMQTYGITVNDWNRFRKTPLVEFKGATFADMTQAGGKKFHQMIMSETDFAVPTPDAKVRAITTGGLQRGTISGEAWRSAFLIKSFPITIATTHFYRTAIQATMGQKIGYGAALLATTTVFGGIALQARDIAAGRDPRPMNNPEFFAAALQQGGGLGLMGDFIFSDTNRFGGGIAETIVGPVGELADTGLKFTHGNIRELIQGEETHILGESIDIVERYTPSIWQIHMFKSSFFDQLEMMADPDAEKKYRRLMRKRAVEYNQDYWWRPGEPLPRRAPEFEGIIED